jgi:hypothetical protein
MAADTAGLVGQVVEALQLIRDTSVLLCDEVDMLLHPLKSECPVSADSIIISSSSITISIIIIIIIVVVLVVVIIIVCVRNLVTRWAHSLGRQLTDLALVTDRRAQLPHGREAAT